MDKENKQYIRVAARETDPKVDDPAWRRASFIVVLKLFRIAKMGPEAGA